MVNPEPGKAPLGNDSTAREGRRGHGGSTRGRIMARARQGDGMVARAQGGRDGDLSVGGATGCWRGHGSETGLCEGQEEDGMVT